MVGHIEGGTQAEGVRGKDAVEDIFLSTRDEVRGEWRRLHNEELHDGYFSPDIRVIYSRRMRWPGHVACTCMEERRGANSFGGET